jgi:hypothetical protein
VACAPAAGFSTGSVEVVDVGTSPHGLSAGLLLSHQETREASSNRPPAKLAFNAFGGCAVRGDERGSAERPTSGGRGAAEPTPMRQTWAAERADKRSASVVAVAANSECQQGRQP